VSTTLFPLADRPLLQILADVGVAIFVFLVGLELDLSEVRARRHHRIATSVALSSVAVPFGLGVAAAALLHRSTARPGCPVLPLHRRRAVGHGATGAGPDRDGPGHRPDADREAPRSPPVVPP